MYTTIDLLNRVKAAYGLESDYALAKKMGVSRQRIHKYLRLGSVMDDEAAFIIASLLDLCPAQIVACMHMERAEKMEDKKKVSFWMEYAKTA